MRRGEEAVKGQLVLAANKVAVKREEHDPDVSGGGADGFLSPNQSLT